MNKFLIGFFVGLLVGWTIGILSAPQSGKETIDTLGERAIELRDKATGKAEELQEEVMSHM